MPQINFEITFLILLLILCVPFSPEVAHGVEYALLGGRLLRMPELSAYCFVGQVLLTDKVTGIVVCILVLLAIVELLHQLGGSIAQVQWYGQVAGLTYIGECLVYSQVGRVALET